MWEKARNRRFVSGQESRWSGIRGKAAQTCIKSAVRRFFKAKITKALHFLSSILSNDVILVFKAVS